MLAPVDDATSDHSDGVDVGSVLEARAEGRPTDPLHPVKSWARCLHASIFVDNGFLRGGDIVQGTAVVQVPQDIKSSTIKLRTYGIERTFWKRLKGADTYTSPIVAQQAYEQQRVCYEMEQILWFDEKGLLTKGAHSLPFKFTLPLKLPRSFEDDGVAALGAHFDGLFSKGMRRLQRDVPILNKVSKLGLGHGEEHSSIRYYSELISIDTTEQVIARKQLDDVCEACAADELAQSAQSSESKLFTFGGNNPCTASLNLASVVVTPGVPHIATVAIANNSTRTVEAVSLRVIREVELQAGLSDLPDALRQNETDDIAAAVGQPTSSSTPAVAPAAPSVGAGAEWDAPPPTSAASLFEQAKRAQARQTQQAQQAPSPTVQKAKKEDTIGKWLVGQAVSPRTVSQVAATFTLPTTLAGSVRFGCLISQQYRLELVLSVTGSRDLIVAVPITVVEHCRGALGSAGVGAEVPFAGAVGDGGGAGKGGVRNEKAPQAKEQEF
jgi:hypothetical protein